MTEIQRATFTVSQMADKIKGTEPLDQTKARTAHFAFFLGAGASAQSGILTAGGMIREFKKRIFETECKDRATQEEKEKWLTEQSWYDSNKPYSALFEHYQPRPYGRQRYIEEKIEGARPSFGYVVLAKMIELGFVNTVITTNFDDLLFSACASFTDVRPVVYSYGVLAEEMRLTSQRPKILKLHGDYLYSKIKNSADELQSQDPNMTNQVAEVLTNYGLIVAGYGGNDDSVMNILRKISKDNYLFWCGMPGEKPNAAVEALLIDKGGFLVEIEGFDEMMNEIRGVLGFDFGTMIESMDNNLYRLVDKVRDLKRKHQIDILPQVVTALRQREDIAPTLSKRAMILNEYTKAFKSEDEQDFAGAEQHYLEVLKIDEGEVDACVNLGRLYVMADHPADAEVAFKRAIEMDDKNAEAYNRLGLIYEAQGKYDQAVSIYQEATKRAPDDPAAFKNLGRLADSWRRNDEAVTYYSVALALDPSDMDTRHHLGLLAEWSGDLTGAEDTFRELLRADPRNAEYHKDLANVLSEQHRSDEAEAEYKQALECDPKYPSAHRNYGLLLIDLERWSGAESQFRQAIELDANYGNAHYSLGDLCEKLQRYAEAETEYREANRLIPNSAFVHDRLGHLIARDYQRLTEAKALLDQAIGFDPNFANAYFHRGLVWLKLGHPQEGEADYRRAIKLDEKNVDYYSRLVSLLRGQKRDREAIPFLDKWLELQPNNYVVALNLAYICAKAGLAAEVKQYLDGARESIPPDNWLNLARLAALENNADSAVDHLRRYSQATTFNRNALKQDPYFEIIRNDPRFKEIAG